MFCKILALELQEGWTALHCAAHAGYLDVAKLLVESGASAEVVPLDSSNSTLADQDKSKDMLIYMLVRTRQRTGGWPCGMLPAKDTTR